MPTPRVILWLTQQIGGGRILRDKRIAGEGLQTRPPRVLPLAYPAGCDNDFAVSSLVGRRNTRPSRSRLESASLCERVADVHEDELAAGIGREFLLA